jgi:hypothetical protein
MSGIEVIAYAAMAAKAMGTIAQGNFAAESAKNQSRQLKAMALREEAMSQREAIEERRAARLLASNARAAFGASGAGVDGDPTVDKILGEIETRGEYNALVAMYEGTMRARQQRFEADTVREEGRSAKKAAYLSAITDLGAGMWEQGAFTNSGLFGMKGTATASRSNLIQPLDMSKLRKRI